MTKILITGAAGYVGSLLHRRLSEQLTSRTETVSPDSKARRMDRNNATATMVSHARIIATDVAFPGPLTDDMEICDITDPVSVDLLFAKYEPDLVYHLASMVNPKNAEQRERAYAVDVEGSRNILDACIKYGTRRLVVTSSGAAYGYHASNPIPITEDQPLKPYTGFAYSHHKQLVEKMLAEHCSTGTKPDVVVFRSGTILGENTRNQITALFEKPRVLGIRGSDTPFVFIWDEDVVGALMHAAKTSQDTESEPGISFVAPAGVYNLAGDGWLPIQDVAAILKKKIRWLMPGPLKILLGIARPLGLSQYGPEQIPFLQYRPVLDNTRLKEVFGYTPEKSSKETFQFFVKSAGLL